MSPGSPGIAFADRSISFKPETLNEAKHGSDLLKNTPLRGDRSQIRPISTMVKIDNIRTSNTGLTLVGSNSGNERDVTITTL